MNLISLAIIASLVLDSTFGGPPVGSPYKRRTKAPKPTTPQPTPADLEFSTAPVEASTFGQPIGNETTPNSISESSTTIDQLNSTTSIDFDLQSTTTVALIPNDQSTTSATEFELNSTTINQESTSISITEPSFNETTAFQLSTEVPIIELQSTEFPIIEQSTEFPLESTSSPAIDQSTLEAITGEIPTQEASTSAANLETTVQPQGTPEIVIPPRGQGQKPTKKHTPPPTLPPIDFDCSKKDDGYYPDAKDKCSSKYYACVGGLGRQLSCPASNLVYEPDTGNCERRQDSFRCTGNKKTTPRTTRPTASPVKVPVDCSKLDDGWYADPQKKCSHNFYSCSNGVGSQFVCPGNMYFDDEIKACESYQDVVACAGKKRQTTQRPVTTLRPKEKIPVDCLNQPSGQYADPGNKCSSTYYVCSNGDGYKRSCPAALFFDATSQWCDFKENIEACGGSKKKQSTQKPTKPPQPSPASLPSKEFDCKNKEDGSYLPQDKKCSPAYFRCVGGVSYKLNCPHGLYYDLKNDACDRYGNLFECSGKQPTSPKPQTTFKPKPTEKLPVDCSKQADGDFADPEKKCSSNYFTCSNQQGIRRLCPFGTFFDKDFGVCDAKENVPACSGKPRPATNATTKAQNLQTTKSPYNCDQKEDGNYAADKCVSHYFACVGGSTISARCPSGTFYDSERDECGYKEEVPACGGKRPLPEQERTEKPQQTVKP